MNRVNTFLPFDETAHPIFQGEFLGNTYYQYFSALALFLLIFLGIRIFRRVILVRLKKLANKTVNDFDDRLLKGVECISQFFTLFLALYLMMKTLNIGGGTEKILDAMFIILLVYEAIKLAQVLAEYTLEKTTKNGDETVTHGLRMMLTIILWSVGILLVLSNLGVNISALAASLGIGGVAVALALQNILGDLFSSFSIYFDKPFQIGDYIIIGEDKGTVQKIGLKTTRIRTLQGEELIVSNKELTSSRVQNFKRMQRRRISFSLGIEYGTTMQQLKKIPKIIEDIIKKQEDAEFDRCHFAEFGDFSLNFNIVYYINTSNYKKYMDIQQNINLDIKDSFEKEGIEMAFPTQTVFIKKEI